MFVGYLSTLLYFIYFYLYIYFYFYICLYIYKQWNIFSQFSLCSLSRELNQFEKENLVEFSKLINDGKG